MGLTLLRSPICLAYLAPINPSFLARLCAGSGRLGHIRDHMRQMFCTCSLTQHIVISAFHKQCHCVQMVRTPSNLSELLHPLSSIIGWPYLHSTSSCSTGILKQWGIASVGPMFKGMLATKKNSLTFFLKCLKTYFPFKVIVARAILSALSEEVLYKWLATLLVNYIVTLHYIWCTANIIMSSSSSKVLFHLCSM